MKYVESKLFGFLHSYESECMKERYYTFRRYVNQIKAKGDHLNIVLSRIDNGFHSLNSIQLSLDIFTFFIFFRVLLDDVAKMTRYLYPKNIADQLPTSFSDLGRNKILKEHDEEFAFFLNKKISTLLI